MLFKRKQGPNTEPVAFKLGPSNELERLVPSAGKWYTYTIKVRDEISGYVGYLGNMARKKQANFHEGKQVNTAGDGRHI